MKKFKFTWAHGIILTMLSFMIFILSLVFNSQYTGKNAGDLVTDNYYEKEINYQQEIDAINQANNLSIKPKVTLESYGILITFPEEFDNKNTTGTFLLYRPSSSDLDINSKLIITADHKVVITKDKLVPGVYELNLYWEKDKVKYQTKIPIKWI